jgi:hypothetical protein
LPVATAQIKPAEVAESAHYPEEYGVLSGQPTVKAFQKLIGVSL